MTGAGGCPVVLAVLPDGVTSVFCMLAKGHDEEIRDVCIQCDLPERSHHESMQHRFVERYLPGTPHVAHVRRDA